jgi:hypothetical protein
MSGGVGYLYIMRNPAMPGLKKIGYTNRAVDVRRNELGDATGVPAAFIAERFIPVPADKAEALEQRVHNLLDTYRPSRNREFFFCSLGRAIEAINHALQGKRGGLPPTFERQPEIPADWASPTPPNRRLPSARAGQIGPDGRDGGGESEIQIFPAQPSDVVNWLATLVARMPS